MKYPRYSAFVYALLVSPLFLAVGCPSPGGECLPELEGEKLCSEARNEILICTDRVWTPYTPCAEGTICEDSAQGPECVSEGGTGGSGGSGAGDWQASNGRTIDG